MIFKDLSIKVVSFTNCLSLVVKLLELLYDNYLLCTHSLFNYNLVCLRIYFPIFVELVKLYGSLYLLAVESLGQ